MKLEDLAEVMGISIDQLKSELEKTDCITLNLNSKKI